MICLFFDTSSEKLNISLLKDNNILFEKQLETKNNHSSFLVPLIDEAIKKNNIEFNLYCFLLFIFINKFIEFFNIVIII